MRNYLHTFMTGLEAFCRNHSMVGDCIVVRGESEIENMVFSENAVVLMIDSANISTEDGNPIYTVRFVAAVVGKGKGGRLGPTVQVEECLFILSQIQGEAERLSNNSAEFGEVDVQSDFDESSDLTALSTIFEVKFGRGYCDTATLYGQ